MPRERSETWKPRFRPPGVDWASGAPETALSGPVTAAGIHISGALVEAGIGQAVGVTGEQTAVASVAATCTDGRTKASITGTADQHSLAAGDGIDLPAARRYRSGTPLRTPTGAPPSSD